MEGGARVDLGLNARDPATWERSADLRGGKAERTYDPLEQGMLGTTNELERVLSNVESQLGSGSEEGDQDARRSDELAKSGSLGASNLGSIGVDPSSGALRDSDERAFQYE